MSDKNVLSDYKGTYIRIDPLYSVDNLILALENYDFIYSSICDYKGYLIKLLRYEEKRKRPDKRYGYLVKVLLPKGSISNKKDKLVKITKELVRGIIGTENLEYISYLKTVCDINYLIIYISDRPYYKFYKEYYTRDYYQDINTRKMCSKDNLNHVLVAKKGTLKRVIKDSFASAKSYIFKGTTEQFIKIINTLKDLYFNILEKFNCIFKSDYVFNHKKYSSNTKRFKKRLFQKINSLMILFENKLYRGLSNFKRYANAYEIQRYGYCPNETITLKEYDDLTSLFYKFNNRFNKMSFHIQGVRFDLDTRTDVALANLDILESDFNKSFNEILNKK